MPLGLSSSNSRAYEVIDHLSPRLQTKPPAASTEAGKEPDDQSSSPVTGDVWKRLDAIVLQWIYGTISTDLLSTIIRPDSTAHYAWTALKSIFHDNQATRAVLLHQKFVNVKLDSFPSMAAYVQEVKVLSDQLANVGSPVTEHTLVIQLLTGLNEAYGGIASILQNTKPFPTFYEARSQLILEETTKANRVSHDTALNTSHQSSPPSLPSNPSPPPVHTYTRGRGRGRGRGHGRGRGRNPSPSWTPFSFSTMASIPVDCPPSTNFCRPIFSLVWIISHILLASSTLPLPHITTTSPYPSQRSTRSVRTTSSAAPNSTGLPCISHRLHTNGIRPSIQHFIFASSRQHLVHGYRCYMYYDA
ncbi:putative RNA-directed DNA polymerase [Helianthus annuus]|uniref:uncharacterized protein LOC110891200 n=1 Tax=Helianthus annuus TaxID=4232 RepID=UPI000B8FE8E6|nr:uncharacterized protein LOC110891200 [Helianthus annuus]XP_021994588.1 uncharacterized protein LOC110891200 [Helianthus annuus]XP_035836013.1 uncharacterized protein LOC110891200 [Helianthus annuus]KAJ0872624.1 putative RNA-directed DNA polymerase [Helianthus annuus]